MDITKQKIIEELSFTNCDIEKNSDFVIYLYLDGHRSSSINKSDLEAYKSGIDFFKRFMMIYQSYGFKDIVLMVHTKRNNKTKKRVSSIQDSIINEFNYFAKKSNNFNYFFYGDRYDTLPKNILYYILKIGELVSSITSGFKIHVLINYSEEWAINNFFKIQKIPSISAIIRFTKGYISGGSIPTKMNKSVFIYSQNASNSNFWSDESIHRLILVSFKNWLTMSKKIGNKKYTTKEKEEICNSRENSIMREIKLTKSNTPKRILIFDEIGPISFLI